MTDKRGRYHDLYDTLYAALNRDSDENEENTMTTQEKPATERTERTPPFTLVMIQGLDGRSDSVGETVSFPCPETGQTHVRLIPGRAWSACFIDTKRLYRPDVGVWDEWMDRISGL